MEDAIRSRLIQAIETHLASCESEISSLAHEALCPSTSALRRAEALILRAEAQTRSVSLSRQLTRLEADQELAGCVHPVAAELWGLHACSGPGDGRCQWPRPWAEDLPRAS